MKHYESPIAECPFYCSETGSSVVCEGFDDEQKIRVSYANAIDTRLFKKNFCKSERNYKRCPIFRMLEAENDKIEK